MSEFEKIEEQENVLNTYDKNIIVSASAGSGKTSVMIRKIIDYIINKNVKIKELLVLTYTNAAASEMKQKLINEMTKMAKDNKKLLDEIEDIPLADISTFDSFCQKLVKRYFYILDIDPGFNITQGSEQTQLQTRALKKAIKNYKQKNKEKYFNLFDCYSSNRTDKNIYSIILMLYNYSCSILDYSKWKQNSYELFDGEENSKASKILLDKTKSELGYINEQLNKLNVMSKDLQFDTYCKYINKIQSNIDILLKQNQFKKMIDFANEIQLENVVRKKAEDEELQPKISYFKSWLSELLTSLKSYKSSDYYDLSVDFCKNIVNTIFDLCDEFIKEYNDIKRRKNVYDYNDIERLTLKLFENKDITQSIKNSYKNIFIDEFQDANAVQEKIIMSLKNNNNLFFVGDLKQAIYGFRQSNPKIFENLSQEFSTDNNSQSFYLNCNFRTTAEILNFINNIFCVIMTEKTASLNYCKKAKLVPKAKYEQEESACCELCIIHCPKEETSGEAKIYSVVENQNQNIIDNAKVEANFVAERITKLLEEKIYDVNLQKYRKIKYSDIAIIVRTRTKQTELVSVLNEYNIPTIENSNKDLEQTYDVSVLINLIKISQNFNNDYSLASIMMSDLFMFDVSEMQKIKNSSSENYFYMCVKNYQKNDEIKEKIDNMLKVIDEFSHIAKYNGLNKALLYAVNNQKYEYKLNNYKNGYSRKKNVKDYISSFNNSNFNYCVSEYLNFLEDSTREQKVVSGVTSDDVVTITTMHSSKGLEWPVVIIPNLSSGLSGKNSTSDIVLNEELGVGVKYFDKTSRKSYPSVFFDVVKSNNKESEFSEKIRLLYVALTRAKNRLILVGTTEKLEFNHFNTDREIKKSSTFLNLIVNSLPEEDIYKINNKMSFNLYNNKNFVCNVVDKSQYVTTNKINLKNVAIDNNNPIVCELANYIQKEYFNIKATKIAQKNSVSSILREEDAFSSINTAPKTLEFKEHLDENISKNELGSLYHKVLEMIDFKDNVSKQDVTSCIEKIKKLNLFTNEVINNLDVNLILNNIKTLQSVCSGQDMLKEKTFVMKIPYNEVENSNVLDEVMIQGICDLIVFGKENILIDYKYSNLSGEVLTKKYNKQMYLYKKAIEYGFSINIKKVFILSIKESKLYDCDCHI